MGPCISRSSFTVTRSKDPRGNTPFLFSQPDAETALGEAAAGDYLMYRDCQTEKIILSVRMPSSIRHYRISALGGLYHLEGQPYGYLDSIVKIHQRRKLNGIKLRRQAYLSAKLVRSFAHTIARSNGNQNTWTNQNGNPVPPSGPTVQPGNPSPTNGLNSTRTSVYGENTIYPNGALNGNGSAFSDNSIVQIERF